MAVLGAEERRGRRGGWTVCGMKNGVEIIDVQVYFASYDIFPSKDIQICGIIFFEESKL